MIAPANANTSISQNEWRNNTLLFVFLFYLGSHKRSHSLGDKEIRRSPPSPAPEQPFRDRSNTLSEKPALPVIRDKYKDLTGEVEVRSFSCSTDDFISCLQVTNTDTCFCWFDALLQESERYAYEWQRCLENALEVCGCFVSMFVCLTLSQSEVTTNVKYLNNYIMEYFLHFLLKCHSINCTAYWTLAVPWLFRLKLCILYSVSQGFKSVF